MKKLLFVGLYFFLTHASFSQNGADSILVKLKENLADTTRVNHLVNLGKVLIDNNPDTVVLLAKEAVNLSEKQQFDKGLLMAYNLIGNVIQRKGDADSAMFYYKKVKEIAERTNDIKGKAIVLNNVGILETFRGDYPAALKSYLEAYNYEKQLDDTIGMAEALNNIGVVHYYMSDMDNTLIYFKKSIALSEEVGDLQNWKKGLINIGAIHQYRKEYDEALEYYRKGLDIAQEINDEVDINIAQHNMAQIHTVRKEYDLAEEYLITSLSFQEKIGSQKGIAIDYTNLGSLYRDQGQNKRAEEYYHKSIEISKKGNFLKQLEDTYGAIAEMYSNNRQFELAYKSSKDYIKLKDSLLNKENARNFAELRTKYETAEKEKALAEEQIKSESLAKKAAEAKLTAESRNKWIILLVSLVVGLSLFFMLMRQHNKRKAQAEKDAAIIAERDKGTQAVFAAQEEERKRISKDLHDGVGQQLSGLKMAFQKVSERIKEENPMRSEELRKLSGVLSESADEVRSISHQMMPKALTELGLIEALDDMLRKSFEFSNINYQLEHFGIEGRMEERIEVSLYRVAQELVTNIIKHANAKKVHVQLFKNQGKVIMVVEDDGIGIKPSKNDGHGLLNMRSRINSLHGEMNLEPSPNSGTLATIRIPINEI
jgi:signal transduction histidine kinase